MKRVGVTSGVVDKKKGLCCPRSDPGSPNVSPFESIEEAGSK
jgi:hypothetical protein